MVALFDIFFGRRHHRHRQNGDRELLNRIEKDLHAMALDLTKLKTSVDRLVKADDAVIAAHSDPAAQAAVDNVADILDAQSVKAEAAVAPAPAPAA